jgi:hypothetical protein
MNNENMNTEEEPERQETIIPSPMAPDPAVLAASIPDLVDASDRAAILDAGLSPVEAELRRLAKKPNLDHLEPATVTDPESGVVLPLFEVGSRIIVERHTDLLSGRPWLDTRPYEVLAIDDELMQIHAFDEELRHHAFLGYSTDLYRVFFHPKKGTWQPTATNVAIAAKARKQKAEGVVTNNTSDPSAPKKRGRPKGSKNRSTADVAADKKKLREERSARQAKRAVKRKNKR